MKNLPEIGDKVTIKNIRTSDRSYNSQTWRVVSVNNTHAQLQATKPKSYCNFITVQLDEYIFSDASTFLDD